MSFSGTCGNDARETAHTMPAAVPPTALVINDDPLQLRLAATCLEKDGMRVLACAHAEEALRLLRQGQTVQVIVTDLHMPRIDGWRFCRLLRSPEYAAFNTMPILVLSATFSGTDAEQITADLGANAFLPIPYDPADLRTHVRGLLAGRTPQASLHVLLVENSPTFARHLQRVFEAHGYTVHVALSGAEARRLMQQRQPDIAVLDYHLPDLLGDQLLIEYKRRVASGVAIMMTTDATPELMLHVTRLGADGYVRKPFEPAYLLNLCLKARRERSLLRVEELLEERTQALHASEAQFRLLFDSIPEAVLVHDTHGTILAVNSTGAQWLGWATADLTGQHLRDIVAPAYASQAVQQLQQAVAGETAMFKTFYIARTGLPVHGRSPRPPHRVSRAASPAQRGP